MNELTIDELIIECMIRGIPINDEMRAIMRELIIESDKYVKIAGYTDAIMNERADQYKIIDEMLIKLRKMIGKGKIGKRAIERITDHLISDQSRYDWI